jgi:mannose-6-phosphate isomerase-like protein (cupin superfamily)
MAYEKLTPQELARKHHQLVEETGRIEEELNRRRAEDRHLVRAEEVEWRDLGESIGMKPKKQVIRRASLVSPELGFNVHNFHAFLAEFPPGSDEGAYHMHGEAVKYYLSGQGIEIVGDKQYQVKAGDTVFIPAHTWHGTQNPGPEPLRFLAVAHSGLGVPICVRPIFKVREDLRREL